MDLQTELRSRGYRFTPQRQLVLEAVVDWAMQPRGVHAWVTERASGVNISTIYRTLELLEESGWSQHAHLSHGAPTYQLDRDAEHVHLICRDCGKVSEVARRVRGSGRGAAADRARASSPMSDI